jgi:hypothetical protein
MLNSGRDVENTFIKKVRARQTVHIRLVESLARTRLKFLSSQIQTQLQAPKLEPFVKAW